MLIVSASFITERDAYLCMDEGSNEANGLKQTNKGPTRF